MLRGDLRITADPPLYCPARVGIVSERRSAIVVHDGSTNCYCWHIGLVRCRDVYISVFNNRTDRDSSAPIEPDIKPNHQCWITADAASVVCFHHFGATDPSAERTRQ